MKKRGEMHNVSLRAKYWYNKIFFIVSLAIMFYCTPLSAQVSVDVHKIDLHLDVGKPIKNESTERALNVVMNIQGIEHTMRRYNERFGNDSVHATKFVDRDPDPKAEDPLTKNYFNVIIGADSATMVHRWFTFLVRSDYNEVLYYDPKQGKTLPIDDWKNVWPASEFFGIIQTKQ